MEGGSGRHQRPGDMTTRERMKVEDLFQIEAVGDPQLSPCGGQVAWVRRRFDPVKDRAVSHIWCTDVETGRHRRMTRGPSDSLPRWSPCGHKLAFSARRDGEAGIWVLPVSGGGEAWKVTGLVPDSAPVWSPCGTRLAVLSQVFSRPGGWRPYVGCPGGDEDRARRQAEEAGAPRKEDESAGEGSDPGAWIRESTARVVVDTLYRMDGEGLYGDRRRQVFWARVTGPGSEHETPCQVTEGEYHAGLPAWSPCGRYLVYTCLREPVTRENATRTDLWLYDLEEGREHHLFRADGPVRGLSWSPGGESVAFSGHASEHDLSTVTGLWRLYLEDWRRKGAALDASDVLNLTAGVDRPVGWGAASDVGYFGSNDRAAVWSADGSTLHFLMGDGGSSGVYSVPASGGDPRPVFSPGGATCSGFSGLPSGGGVVLSGTPVAPPDLHYLDLAGRGGPRRLTGLNDEFLSSRAVGRVHAFSYPAKDGWDVDGWLILPPGDDGGAGDPVPAGLPSPGADPLPLVVFVHGGPHGTYGNAFYFGMQAVAATGAAVLYTNPRGSDGYGQEFMNGVIGDWGGGDLSDILKGVDALVDAGIADPDRLGITGWSYGGYMTAWAITQTPRFRAAVSGAPVSNILSDYGTTDTGIGFGDHNFSGAPWERPGHYVERSPVMHVENSATPLLLLHGEDDIRCNAIQSEEMYTALRRVGGEVYMVLYPGESHILKKPRNIYDRVLRTVSWFSERL